MDDLKRSILSTLAWFSLFQTPMTAFEVWKWLLRPSRVYSLLEVDEALHAMAAVQQKYGFWALADEDLGELIETRNERFLDAVQKLAIARRVARYASMIPSVRAVAMVNTLSWWNTRTTSDIDFLIVTRPGMVWSTRLLLVTPFLRRRPAHDQSRKNPLCFSFFVSEDAFDLEPLLLESDPYFSYWLPAAVPLFDEGGVLEALHAMNPWVQNDLPHAGARSGHPYLRVEADRSLIPQVRMMESLARSLQEKRFPAAIREKKNSDSRVVVRDDMLKFHENDRREQYRDQHTKKVSTL